MVSVSPELHAKVLRRDGQCFLSRPEFGFIHQCADQWGYPHPATDLGKMTVDHVHAGYGMLGKRAPDSERWLVAMCANSNIAGPSRAVRQAEREYLSSLYPE